MKAVPAIQIGVLDVNGISNSSVAWFRLAILHFLNRFYTKLTSVPARIIFTNVESLLLHFCERIALLVIGGSYIRQIPVLLGKLKKK